jgi:outer membrane scaffolding protein for murein synthesis (MipA/OmpV family)
LTTAHSEPHGRARRAAPRAARRALQTSLLLALGAVTMPAQADERPLWELGVGAGLIAFNDYRGASAGHVLPLPFGDFIYRGRFLRSDREGVRDRLMIRHYVEFELSANASAPVYSSSSGARAGMPNLDPTVESGPSVRLHLWRGDDDHLRLDLRTPLREAVTVSLSPRAIGFEFTPQLNLDLHDLAWAPGWNLGLLAGPEFAQASYNRYFYGVASQYATPSRPAYEPGGGYAGSEVLLATSKRFGGYWLGAYLRHDWLQHAVFASSPLMQQAGYWSAGFGIVWYIKSSKRMVQSDE